MGFLRWEGFITATGPHTHEASLWETNGDDQMVDFFLDLRILVAGDCPIRRSSYCDGTFHLSVKGHPDLRCLVLSSEAWLGTSTLDRAPSESPLDLRVSGGRFSGASVCARAAVWSFAGMIPFLWVGSRIPILSTLWRSSRLSTHWPYGMDTGGRGLGSGGNPTIVAMSTSGNLLCLREACSSTSGALTSDLDFSQFGTVLPDYTS